jgi:hypothetical protein
VSTGSGRRAAEARIHDVKYVLIAAGLVVVLAAMALRSSTFTRSVRSAPSPPVEEQPRPAEPSEAEGEDGREPVRPTLAEGAPAADGVYRGGPMTVAPDPGQPQQTAALAGITVELDLGTGEVMIVVPQRIDTNSTSLRGTQRVALAEDEDTTLELDPTPGDETGVAVEVDWGTARGTWKDLRELAGIVRLSENSFTFDVGLEYRFAVGGTRYTVKLEVSLPKEGEAHVRVLDGTSLH